jgi:hypothetical protein
MKTKTKYFITALAALAVGTLAAVNAAADPQGGQIITVAMYITGVPQDASVGIGRALHAFTLDSPSPYEAGWQAAYGGVTKADFDAYVAYFARLGPKEKRGSGNAHTFEFEWGRIQTAYNEGRSQLSVTWLVR